MTKRQRLDVLLVQRGLATSREQAQQLIRAGWVRQAGRVLDKPGTALPAETPLEVEARPRFVSRGGDKLAAALAAFPLAIAGRVCLDGGLSTGGFSDCLLQAGAQRVYGIDVGYGQVAWSLRTDPRLVTRERTNLRHLTPADLYGPDDPRPDLAVADLSFISLRCVLPALGSLLQASSPTQRLDAVLLVKPQFEVGRGGVGKGGVVRDPAGHASAIAGVRDAAVELGWQAVGLVGSPITGPAGNHEYLLWLQSAPGGLVSGTGSAGPVDQSAIQAVVAATLAGG
ncbi:MAG: TlyA family RNA methyltransferase [Cyanobacteriota bacterium]|jgi:23S rRNA (cytidine1920-2'-O)/16S rRNA (cytidine1409-2'-O)-methyltransferase|nr:TlyA family RNA methyltransferase [Cyanobacteriota bacterium]